MFSKDKIQAEEAQGQFAERMPAGMQLLAKAHGTTVKQLREDMKNGKLDPKKLIPELGKIMENLAESTGGYAKALESTRVAQGRFNATFEESVILFADSGMDRALAMFFREGATQMERSTNLIKAMGGAFEYLMVPVRAFMRLVGDFSERVLPKLAEYFGISEKAVISFGGASLLAMTPWGRIGLIIAGIITALDDFATYLKGGTSEFGKWMESLSPENQQRMKDFGNAVAGLGESLLKVFELSAQGWSNIFSWLEEGGAGWTVIDGVTALANGINQLVDAMIRWNNNDLGGFDKMSETDGMLVQRHNLWNLMRGNTTWEDTLTNWTGGTREVPSYLKSDYPAQLVKEDRLGQGLSAQAGQMNNVPPLVVNFEVNGVQGAQDLETRIPSLVDKALQQTFRTVGTQVTPQKK